MVHLSKCGAMYSKAGGIKQVNELVNKHTSLQTVRQVQKVHNYDIKW